MTNQYQKVANLDNLKTSKLLHVRHQDIDICLAYVENTVYAIDDMCTHEDASLSKGSLHGDCVKCPLHGSRFDLATGKALDEPAEDAVKTYSVKIEGNDILLSL